CISPTAPAGPAVSAGWWRWARRSITRWSSTDRHRKVRYGEFAGWPETYRPGCERAYATRCAVASCRRRDPSTAGLRRRGRAGSGAGGDRRRRLPGTTGLQLPGTAGGRRAALPAPSGGDRTWTWDERQGLGADPG